MLCLRSTHFVLMNLCADVAQEFFVLLVPLIDAHAQLSKLLLHSRVTLCADPLVLLACQGFTHSSLHTNDDSDECHC